jgi:heavy metal translocating P-type ATPase
MVSQNTAGFRRPVVCSTDDTGCDELDLKHSRSWLRIAIAGVFAGQGMVFSLALSMTPPPYGSLPYWVLHGGLIFSSLMVMAFLGGRLFASTFGMLRSRRLSIEGLFTLSLLGAFFGSLIGSITGEGAVFYEIVSIVIAIYTFGRMLGEHSQAKLLKESGRLREKFDQANLIGEQGAQLIEARSVKVGDQVQVDPGAAFTLDGVVESGVGYVRETALTGEPLPVVRRCGDVVRAGTYSEDGAFTVRVSAGVGDRELDQILGVVEGAQGEPSALQGEANRLIQYFLPLVACIACTTAVFWAVAGTWVDAVLNSMAVLLVACPCALGLATPVAIWHGLYRLSRMGLVSRNGSLIDALARTQTIFFDKTGTLSESEMVLGETLLAEPWENRREALFAALVAVESRSSHPVARTLVRQLPIDPLGSSESPEVLSVRILPGVGLEARVSIEGSEVDLRIGELADSLQSTKEVLEMERELRMQEGKRVYVSIDQELAVVFVLSERARVGVSGLWERLDALGVEAAILTGDPAPELSLPEQIPLRRGLSAEEKEQIVAAAKDRLPVFVGDGINDTAAMAVAAASVSMESGTGLARSSATAQLVHDRLEILPEAVELSRGIYQRLRGNLVYAFCYNIAGMAFASAGLLHPVVAALIMLVSSFFVTLRAAKV